MLRMLFALGAAATLAGCAVYAQSPVVGPGHPVPYPVPHSAPHPGVEVPLGHMPPPGTCRIWYLGVEPGQQPPPGDCRELQFRVPPGAVLIRG